MAAVSCNEFAFTQVRLIATTIYSCRGNITKVRGVHSEHVGTLFENISLLTWVLGEFYSQNHFQTYFIKTLCKLKRRGTTAKEYPNRSAVSSCV